MHVDLVHRVEWPCRWAVLGDRSDEVVRSVSFLALVLGNLALILVNRSWQLSVWRSLRERRNPTLKWMLTAAGTLLVLLVAVPWLRHALVRDLQGLTSSARPAKRERDIGPLQ